MFREVVKWLEFHYLLGKPQRQLRQEGKLFGVKVKKKELYWNQPTFQEFDKHENVWVFFMVHEQERAGILWLLPKKPNWESKGTAKCRFQESTRNFCCLFKGKCTRLIVVGKHSCGSSKAVY